MQEIVKDKKPWREQQAVDCAQCSRLASILSFETCNPKRGLGAAKIINGGGILVAVPKATLSHTSSKAVNSLDFRFNGWLLNTGTCGKYVVQPMIDGIRPPQGCGRSWRDNEECNVDCDCERIIQ